MIEILPFKDKKDLENLYKTENIDLTDFCLAVVAKEKEEFLGYALFSIDKNALTLFKVKPIEDIYLCDGLIRSALHVGVENGVTDAYFKNEDLRKSLLKLGFLEDENSNNINIQKLFGGCCGCNV